MLNGDLLNLPWATLVTLASGYIGYFIANVGVNEHHKTRDVTFTMLVGRPPEKLDSRCILE